MRRSVDPEDARFARELRECQNCGQKKKLRPIEIFCDECLDILEAESNPWEYET